MEEYVQFTEIDNIYYTREIKDHLTMSDFLGLEEVNPGEGMPVLENIETIGYFTELFRADYEGMTEGDINTMMEAYLYGGEFVHESYHPFGNFISGILDVTIVKPLIECVIGKDLITGDKLTGCTVSLEVEKYVFRDGGKIVKQLDADEMLEYVGKGGQMYGI